MIRIFKSKVICEQLENEELQKLSIDFKRYKQFGELPDTFGRDVPYNHSNTLPILKIASIQHIHIVSVDKRYLKEYPQYYRTSDTHLVYCKGALKEHCYLLMAILSPDAHKQARNRDIMFRLGTMAEAFQNKY